MTETNNTHLDNAELATQVERHILNLMLKTTAPGELSSLSCSLFKTQRLIKPQVSDRKEE